LPRLYDLVGDREARALRHLGETLKVAPQVSQPSDRRDRVAEADIVGVQLIEVFGQRGPITRKRAWKPSTMRCVCSRLPACSEPAAGSGTGGCAPFVGLTSENRDDTQASGDQTQPSGSPSSRPR